MRLFYFLCSFVSASILCHCKGALGLIPGQQENSPTLPIQNDVARPNLGPPVFEQDRIVTVRVRVEHLYARLARQRGYTALDFAENNVPVLQELQYRIGRELTLRDELEFKLSTRWLRQRNQLYKIADQALLHDMLYVMVRLTIIHP